MGRVIEHIQRAQDTFARQSQLSLLLLSADGGMMTKPSRHNDHSNWLIENYLAKAHEWVHRIEEAGIIDAWPGLKVILSPVRVEGRITHYIWAGAWSDEESRHLLQQYVEEDEHAPAELQALLQELQIFTSEQTNRCLHEMQELSDLLGVLLSYDEEMRRGREAVWGLEQVSTMVGKEDAVQGILRQMLAMSAALDFIGLAIASGDECRVSEMAGEDQALALTGTRFAQGEGFLGQVMATGIPGHWHRVEHDPRADYFRRHNIQPHALICYPLIREDKVIGVLFAGANRTITFGKSIETFCRIYANFLAFYLTKQELHSTMHQQVQRLSAVMEICQLITRMRDPSRVAMMLVDMSLNIMQSKFAALTLFHTESQPDEVRMMSRGLTTRQSEQYGKLLLQHYSGVQRNGGAEDKFVPIRRELEWGATVLECPLYYSKLYGILSVAIDSMDDDSEAFLSTIATVGALTFHQTAQSEENIQQRVTDLHEATGYWDPTAYEFAGQLRQQAVSFMEYLRMPLSEVEVIGQACLLVPYQPEALGRILKPDHEICRIVEDFAYLRNSPAVLDSSPTGDREAGIGGQIMRMATDYLRNKEGTNNVRNLPGVDVGLVQKFNDFLLRSRMLDQQISVTGPVQSEIEGLSKREQEVLRLIVQGQNNKQIAASLFISEHTVKNHITNIYQKLDISDRAGVMAYFYNRK